VLWQSAFFLPSGIGKVMLKWHTTISFLTCHFPSNSKCSDVHHGAGSSTTDICSGGKEMLWFYTPRTRHFVILSRDRLTVDGFRIGDSIYFTL
jgi:hypothetical protein